MFHVPITDVVQVVVGRSRSIVGRSVCNVDCVCVRGGVCVCCVGAYPAGCDV